VHAPPLPSPAVSSVSSSENLRREARVDVRVPVTVYRGKRPLELETSDVSFKGLFVCTSDPPPLRSLVKLRVALVGREFEAHAMAVHVVLPKHDERHDEGTGAPHQPGVGLQFWGLSGSDRAAWDEFVRGLVHARRGPVRRPTDSQPALSEPATPSGVRIIVTRTTLASAK
jgi:hypothetical protein